MKRVVLVGAAWTGLWWLIIGGLTAPVLPGGWIAVLVAACLAYLPFLVLVRALHGGGYPSASVRLLVFRPFWYGQLGALLAGLAGAAGFLLGAPFGAAVRTGRWTLGIMLALAITAAAVGYVGSRTLRVKRLEVRSPRVPAAFDRFRIVQVSDLHVGPHTPRRFLGRIAKAIEDAHPDLVAVTGDQVDDYAGDVRHFARAFGRILSGSHVFAVAGNHDIYAGWAPVRAGLEAMGITVLVNDSMEIARGASRIWIAGTGDPAGAGFPRPTPEAAPNIERTLAGIPRDGFTLVLAHNPALWPDLASRGADLTLSGHTHYGQLSVPRMGWSLASLFLEHAMGSHKRDRSLLYINPGTNYWGLPLRIGALPEVTVLTLRRSDTGEPDIVSG
jgi:predicted MPP superfamily phosphohydrolase